MPKTQGKKKTIRYTKIRENVGQSKEQNKTLETNPKEMQIYKLPDQKKKKEIKITAIKILRELTENTTTKLGK